MLLRTLVAATCLALFVAPPAHAGDASAYAGTWTFDESSGDRAAAEAAVNALADEYTVLIRGLVRKKLMESVKISPTLKMEPGDDSMTITSEFSTWTSDLSATETAVLNPQGETVVLKRWLEGDELHAVGSTGSGSAGFVFQLGDDGKTMTLHVKTEAPRLKRPLEYALTYRKK